MPRRSRADLVRRVEQACRTLADSEQLVTFDDVAIQAGVGRATLYRHPELRALIEEHRREARETLTLTGLATQLDQLRAALEAVAANVRRHEEVLRQLQRARRTERSQTSGLAG